jgi:hypothetical protein
MNCYEKYGNLIVQAEILNAQIQECKKEISIELNKKPEVKEEPKCQNTTA